MLTKAAAESSLFPLSTLRISPESRSETLVGISPIIIGRRRGLIPRKTVMYTLPKGKNPCRTRGWEDKAMKNIYQMRNEFTLREYNTAITREDFERSFTKTRDKVRFTFQGWDGKSYDGESRNASVYRTGIKGYEDVRFIKVGKHVHYIEEDHMVVEKATGEAHPTASWLVDVLPARKEG